MTEKELLEANIIHNEIKRIDDFLFAAEKVWTGKLSFFFRKTKLNWLLTSSHFGLLQSREYELDNETKNEMLEILRNKREKLKIQLENIGGDSK